jgi:hypothetical protein
VGVRDFLDWFSVVKCCTTDLIKPTLLFYQQVHPQSKKNSDSLTIESFDLSSLERQAKI